MITEKGWLMDNVSYTTPLVQSEADLLAAITHKLGNDGRARAQICPHCKLHDRLQTLATHTGDKYGTTSLCTQCKKIVVEAQHLSCYNDVPWDQDKIVLMWTVPEDHAHAPSPLARGAQGFACDVFFIESVKSHLENLCHP